MFIPLSLAANLFHGVRGRARFLSLSGTRQCKNLQGPGVICISWRRMFRSESHTNRTLARITPVLGACLVYICGNGNSSTFELADWLTEREHAFSHLLCFLCIFNLPTTVLRGSIEFIIDIRGIHILLRSIMRRPCREANICYRVLERKLQESLNLQIGAEIEWRIS